LGWKNPNSPKKIKGKKKKEMYKYRRAKVEKRKGSRLATRKKKNERGELMGGGPHLSKNCMLDLKGEKEGLVGKRFAKRMTGWPGAK